MFYIFREGYIATNNRCYLTLSDLPLARQSLIERSEETLLDSPLSEYFVPRSPKVIEWGWIAFSC